MSTRTVPRSPELIETQSGRAFRREVLIGPCYTYHRAHTKQNTLTRHTVSASDRLENNIMHIYLHPRVHSIDIIHRSFALHIVTVTVASFSLSCYLFLLFFERLLSGFFFISQRFLLAHNVIVIFELLSYLSSSSDGFLDKRKYVVDKSPDSPLAAVKNGYCFTNNRLDRLLTLLESNEMKGFYTTSTKAPFHNYSI